MTSSKQGCGSVSNSMFSLVALLIISLPTDGDTAPITCYNDEGVAVDWFYIYKLPHKHGSKTQNDGQKYLLMDKGSERWTDGKVLVNDSTGALGRTVGQLYQQEKSSELAYILYNDQSPPEAMGDRWFNQSGNRGGHTKGVVLLDKNQGFWLVHSTPRFPPVQKKGPYSYPSTGVINGQNFICVTYPLERFQTIGEQLQINQPNVYDCDVPASLASLVPSIAAVCKKNQMTNSIFPYTRPAANRSMSLTSLGGTKFISFAKGASFNNDLYHSWVAPTLQSNLLVQFWVRSTGILPSNCTLGWKVLDITSLSPGQKFTYKASQDHSKWAISTKGNWVCVGDINRNQAEEKRGGGTVCQQDALVWKAYRMAALQCQMCGGTIANCATSVG
ncbi:deoxyribonuclease-2-alpha isoform X2 [Hypomesus transpacificus]|uniref:deoxyribonuclease-2-alpha isoform X2 n=1 Tax=Hypomesus transpacificus TaxID=137520 RepID=UPI001F088706|nr:deoxyribonuclease-2-alpha isoform X2 [Hypomesus transpacificus]